jgi:hypothetical protein
MKLTLFGDDGIHAAIPGIYRTCPKGVLKMDSKPKSKLGNLVGGPIMLLFWIAGAIFIFFFLKEGILLKIVLFAGYFFSVTITLGFLGSKLGQVGECPFHKDSRLLPFIERYMPLPRKEIYALFYSYGNFCSVSDSLSAKDINQISMTTQYMPICEESFGLDCPICQKFGELSEEKLKAFYADKVHKEVFLSFYK